MSLEQSADVVRDLLGVCRLLLHVIEINNLEPVDRNYWSIKERAELAIVKATHALKDDDALEAVSVDDIDFAPGDGAVEVRIYNCLRNENIKTLRDLLRRSPRDLLKIKNLGRKSLNEIIKALAARNLTLPKRSRL